ncbi:ABC transporter permease subunit [Heyndrickxia sp. NPDC080065]|uniref:ABC transporter permease subunit n=1 Tax=Heyndrickxia sp. NPDC080065 TaxID=3390568 RepID=UPI003D02E96E
MKNWSLLIGSILFSMIIFLGLAAPHLPFVDSKLTQHLLSQDDNGRPIVPAFAPSEDFPLGSNYQGVDLLSLLLMGTNETLIIIFSIAILRYALAIPLGIGAYYFQLIRAILSGWNQLFSYLPPIFFVGMMVGIPFIMFSKFHALWMIFLIAIIEVGRVADIFLKNMESTSEKPFVESGIVAGCTRMTMFRKYLWPHLQPHIFTNFFNDLGRILFLIAQLGVFSIFISHEFITNLDRGYDTVNSSIAWPTHLASIIRNIWGQSWIPISGITIITITLFSLHLIANGLERYFQRKTNKSEGVGI